MNDSKNEGIIISGGKINAEQIAVGKNATTIRYLADANESLDKKGFEEIISSLNALVEAINKDGDALHDKNEVIKSTEIVALELSKEKPNKITIRSVLDDVTSNIKSIASIATAIEALKAAVALFL